MWKSLIDILPRGNTLGEADWQRRHRLLLWVLVAHVPVLAAIGVALGNPLLPLAIALAIPLLAAGLGGALRDHRRPASAAVTFGLVWCSTALVGITGGSIEAHFHFFIIIGFIALYQDWAPFLLNVLFTVISHGVGSMWLRTLIFNHPAGQQNPWLWSLVHGVAVLLACVGVMLFWRVTEDEQNQKDDLTRKLADGEIARRRFTSDLLVNLARRNQTMLYRQLEIINQLEESERNPDALAELFRLDHLTTRVRRNAENLLVLSGEKPPRVWSQPVPLRDVVRAAIAETEDLDRVLFEIPEGPLVDGASVTDLTHLLAELTENAVRFSPPDMAVTIRCRRDPRGGRGQLLTVEDWGVGMEEPELGSANALLSDAPEIDLSVSKRLGFHVVARLAARHEIRVTLSPTPGSGITASVTLPGTLFDLSSEPVGALPAVPATASRPGRPAPRRAPAHTGSPRPVRPSPTARTVTAVRASTDRAPSDRELRHLTDTSRIPTGRTSTPGTWTDTPFAAGTVEGPAADDTNDHARPAVPMPRLPLPVETASPGRRRADWEGWWDGPADEADERADGAAAPAALSGGPTTRGALRVEPMPAARSEAPVRPVPAVPTTGTPGTGTPGTGTPGTGTPGTGTPTDTPVRPVAAVAEPPAAGDPATTRLRRRVPQAHLAPGLRVIPPQPESDTAPPPSAAEALSRYQASREAARSAVEDGTAPERTSR